MSAVFIGLDLAKSVFQVQRRNTSSRTSSATNELRAMADSHAELHADRARVQAELAWPWWRRLTRR